MDVAERKRRINLLCPSVSSKIVQITAWDDQKLDLGSIARVFGLDPNSLKLNGHFISRGVDLIACSVTWKSLIGFFCSRGLSTGGSESDALVVSGKLGKIGCKRSHDPSPNEIASRDDRSSVQTNKKPQLECRMLQNSHKFKENNSGPQGTALCNHSGPNVLDLKRKLCLDDAILLKRPRIDGAGPGNQERSCGTSTNSRFSCSLINRSMKRLRVEEMVAAAPSKKVR